VLFQFTQNDKDAMIDTKKPIYLDHNASTPVLPEVVDAMLPYLREHFGNPSSTHIFGQRMHQALEQAREQVAKLIECSAEEIYFTSGGTESNNLAIRGVTTAQTGRRKIMTSVIEHPATAQPCAMLENQGYQVSRAPVDGNGRVDADWAARNMGSDTALVSIMHANSETGTLQPIAQLAELAHQVGAIMHTDAAQSCGKVDVSVKSDNVDLLSIAGHKLYAPQGVGALFVKAGTPIAPLLLGGGHERGLRPGTENIAAIVGLGQACEMARLELDRESNRVSGLRDQLCEMLMEAVPGLMVNGGEADRLPNTLNLRFPGISGNALLAACPGIAASTGSACHAGGDSASEVILAMGVPESSALGSVRLSLGRQNTFAEIETAASELIAGWQKLT
jgi:cysteine desulfurase